MIYSVSISFPDLGSGYFTNSIEAIGPYDAAERSINHWSDFPVIPNEVFANTDLLDIIPIHNAEGIRDKTQISAMENEVVLGKEIIHDNGLPNCKLVLLLNGRLLLFDGHHTILAYISSGKKLLKQVPHMIIALDKLSPVNPEDIASFFPNNYQSKVRANWSKYVVNWQADTLKQLEDRKVQTVGELVDALGDRHKSPSQ